MWECDILGMLSTATFYVYTHNYGLCREVQYEGHQHISIKSGRVPCRPLMMATPAKRLTQQCFLSVVPKSKSVDDVVVFFAAWAQAVILSGYCPRCVLKAMVATCRTGYTVLSNMWAQVRHLLSVQEQLASQVPDARNGTMILNWYRECLFETVSVDSSEDEEVTCLDTDVEDVLSQFGYTGSPLPWTPKRRPRGSPLSRTPSFSYSPTTRPRGSLLSLTPDLSSSQASTLIMGPGSPGSQFGDTGSSQTST